MRMRACPCGSGELSSWTYDARGIPLFRSCDKCHDAKAAKYRPDVLANPNYDADEPIEED